VTLGDEKEMKAHYIGVDIAGAENTWAAGLIPSADGLDISFGPKKSTCNILMDIVNNTGASAVAIDGQLSLALSDENGFRSSDNELRALLPTDCKAWVASANSLMAVPLRARLLAESLAPAVGTILETHPRASLLLFLGHRYLNDIRDYKSSTDSCGRLGKAWADAFCISGGVATPTDGAVDALVCATVAYAYHCRPHIVRHLRHTATDRGGTGPFVVLDSNTEKEDA
jgi:predicted nuclease with RNAse H fold